MSGGKAQSPTKDNGKADADGVDPRIQIELERLNSATDAINHLEVDLDDGRATFRQLLVESTAKIDQLAKKLGTCIERARPYYDARMKAKEALQETQKAAVRFERANSAHVAAKEMVALAEEGLRTEGRIFDHAWQEMLNHATMRVNEAERERASSEEEHRKTSFTYQQSERRVQGLQRELKKAIVRSRPYFEMKAHFNQLMEDQKRCIRELEEKVMQSKLSYADALSNLERISDEIHQNRQQANAVELGVRSAGVGAESPVCQNRLLSSENALSALWMSGDASSSSSSLQKSESIIHPLTDEYYQLPSRLNPLLSPLQIKNAAATIGYDKEEFRALPSQLHVSFPIPHNIVRSPSDMTICSSSCSLPTNTFELTLADSETTSLTSQNQQVSSSDQWDGNIRSSSVPHVSSLPRCAGSQEERKGLLSKSGKTNLELPLEELDLSDSESLASVDVLNDEQIACLMLERELQDAYEEVLATPVAEETPLIPN